jgi:hypothetical protein
MIENATDGCKTTRNMVATATGKVSLLAHANIRQVLKTNQDGASEQPQESKIVER